MRYIPNTKWFHIAVLISAWVYVFGVRTGFPTGPLEGGGDLAGYEATGEYVWSHLTFNIVPRVDFNDNSRYYPTGAPAVFQSWGFERDYVYSIGRTLFGYGPWLQYYFLLSQILFAVFAYLLLRTQITPNWAFLMACIAGFGNIYVLRKYPGHFGLSVVHWSALGIMADAILCHQLSKRLIPSVDIVLFRVFCLVASFGLEIGYVLAMTLSSVLICLTFAFFYVLLTVTDKKKMLDRLIACWRKGWNWKSWTLILAIFTAAYFYLSLFTQLYLEIKSLYSINPIVKTEFIVSPLRIFFPFRWGLFKAFSSQMNDTIEGSVDKSVGWSFLWIFFVALFYALKKKAIGAVPVIFTFLSFLFYNPEPPSLLNWMRYLPWFEYSRVGGRVTMALPALIASLSIYIPCLRHCVKRHFKASACFSIFLLIFLVLEFPFYKRFILLQNRTPPVSDAFLNYMKKLRLAKGEAVLDWPFCDYLVSCGESVSRVWAFQKYHSKKVLGSHFARVLPQEYRNIYSKLGLSKLNHKQVSECLSPKQMRILHLFYSYYDFAALHFYQDSVPKACKNEFREIFGEPRQIRFPVVGLTNVYPRSNRLQNYARGRKSAGNFYSHVQAVRKILRSKSSQLFVPVEWVELYEEILVALGSSGKIQVLAFQERAARSSESRSVVIVDAKDGEHNPIVAKQ